MHTNRFEKTGTHCIDELQEVNILQYGIGLFNCCLQIHAHMLKNETDKKLHKIKFITCKN